MTRRDLLRLLPASLAVPLVARLLPKPKVADPPGGFEGLEHPLAAYSRAEARRRAAVERWANEKRKEGSLRPAREPWRHNGN